MVKKELIERSPLRILEKSTHGGVGKGAIGVFAAKKGAGKTAGLVHLAVDQLFQDKHVIHVSFNETTDHIINWYEDIFKEIAKKGDLADTMGIHDEIIKNRIIMSYTQDGIHITEIEKSIKNLIENGNFSADVMVVDGYNFNISSADELKEFREFAGNLGLSLWFSVNVEEAIKDSELPEVLKDLSSEIDVIIGMQQKTDHIHLALLKDHDAEVKDMNLKLDPETLLIAVE